MKFLNDENGQGAAEYLLLFAGVMVIAITVLLIYSSYFNSQPFDFAADIESVRDHVYANSS